MGDVEMGANMLAARKFRNITREDAAKRFGVSVQSMYNYEHGKTSPSAETVKAMVVLYGCSSDYLLAVNNDFNPT